MTSAVGAMQARLALGEAHSLISQVEKLCRQAQGVSLPLHLIKESNLALKYVRAIRIKEWGTKLKNYDTPKVFAHHNYL